MNEEILIQSSENRIFTNFESEVGLECFSSVSNKRRLARIPDKKDIIETCLLNAGLEHSRFDLVFKPRRLCKKNLIFGMFYCLYNSGRRRTIEMFFVLEQMFHIGFTAKLLLKGFLNITFSYFSGKIV